jgi:hypothetical protein
MGVKPRGSKYAVAVAFAGSIVLGGCQQMGSGQAATPMPQGFTCCNFHYEKDWINDGNYAELPFIPAGTPAKVTNYGRYRAGVDIGGKPMRLGQDYGREQESLEAWVAKMIIPTDPKLKIATYPAAVQEAIREGRIMKGMTKEQVIISIGYPMTSETRSLNDNPWRYWVSSFGPYTVSWNAQGRVEEIAADSAVASMIVYRPRK